MKLKFKQFLIVLLVIGLLSGGFAHAEIRNVLSSFLQLSDTPTSITANQCVKGNSGGTALEFGACGTVTGDITVQSLTATSSLVSQGTLSVDGASTLTGNVTAYGTYTGYSVVATSSLSSQGTLAVTGNSTLTGTLTVNSASTFNQPATAGDLIATSSLDIPSGAAPTVDAEGEIAIDTTENQFVAYGGAKRVIDEDGIRSFCVPIASSTDIVSGDYLELLEFPYASVTVFYQSCIAQDGTSQVVNLADTSGTNNMTSITCATTKATSTPSSNNTFTGGASVAGSAPENVRIEFGTNTGNVRRISYCAYYRINAQ